MGGVLRYAESRGVEEMKARGGFLVALCVWPGIVGCPSAGVPEPLDAAAKWIAETRDFWATRLDALERLLREEDAAKH
jgi:hypothetical protein